MMHCKAATYCVSTAGPYLLSHCRFQELLQTIHVYQNPESSLYNSCRFSSQHLLIPYVQYCIPLPFENLQMLSTYSSVLLLKYNERGILSHYNGGELEPGWLKQSSKISWSCLNSYFWSSVFKAKNINAKKDWMGFQCFWLEELWTCWLLRSTPNESTSFSSLSIHVMLIEVHSIPIFDSISIPPMIQIPLSFIWEGFCWLCIVQDLCLLWSVNLVNSRNQLLVSCWLIVKHCYIILNWLCLEIFLIFWGWHSVWRHHGLCSKGFFVESFGGFLHAATLTVTGCSLDLDEWQKWDPDSLVDLSLTASVLCGLDQDLHNALFFSGYSPSSSLDVVSWGSYKWCIMLGVVTIEAKGVAVAVVEPSLVGPSATFACEEIQSDIQWGWSCVNSCKGVVTALCLLFKISPSMWWAQKEYWIGVGSSKCFLLQLVTSMLIGWKCWSNRWK